LLLFCTPQRQRGARENCRENRRRHRRLLRRRPPGGRTVTYYTVRERVNGPLRSPLTHPGRFSAPLCSHHTRSPSPESAGSDERCGVFLWGERVASPPLTLTGVSLFTPSPLHPFTPPRPRKQAHRTAPPRPPPPRPPPPPPRPPRSASPPPPCSPPPPDSTTDPTATPPAPRPTP